MRTLLNVDDVDRGALQALARRQALRARLEAELQRRRDQCGNFPIGGEAATPDTPEPTS